MPHLLHLARNKIVHSQMAFYGIGGAAFLLHKFAQLHMSVAYLAIVRQECRTSYKCTNSCRAQYKFRLPKIRMSRNACENRQFVPFWLIFVTRLLRNPAQIADFRAIFLHKMGFLCKFLSVHFTFWAVGRENSGPEREIPSPGIFFSGLGIFISGLV